MKPLDSAFHEQLGLLLADIGRKGVPYDGAKNVQIAELLEAASEDNCFTRGNSCHHLVQRNRHRLFIADTFSKQMSIRSEKRPDSRVVGGSFGGQLLHPR